MRGEEKGQTIKVLFETLDIIKGQQLAQDKNYTETKEKAIGIYENIKNDLPEDKRHLIKDLDKELEDLLDLRDNIIYSLGLKEGINIKANHKKIQEILKRI